MMERSSIFTKGSNSQQTSTPDAVSDVAWKKSGPANFLTTQTGFDLTQVPARPGLRTAPGIQCCGKDGGPCSCPSCSKASESKADGEEMQSTQETEPVEQISSATQESSGVQAEVSEEQTMTALIVDDSTSELSEGQMKKSEFLQQLRAQICTAIGPVLASVGQTTEGCPYLNYWLDLYQQKEATHIEHTVKKYAPDSSGATSAAEYISLVTERAFRAAEIWASTGKLSGVPEGVPIDLPGQTAEQGNVGPVMAKAKEGGARSVDHPSSIQKELGSGQQLEGGVRSRMESAFGRNFSHVRTHTDGVASGLSNQVNARAFTVGNHVAFGSGEYKPGTILGDALIAHELAHTIQQDSSQVNKMESDPNNYDHLEKDADMAAENAVNSIWSGNKNFGKSITGAIPGLRSGLRIQRCSKDKKAEKLKVNIRPVNIAEDDGKNPTTLPSFESSKTIWGKCCLDLTVGSTTTVKKTDFLTLDESPNDTPTAEESSLFSTAGGFVGISVFVPKNFHQGGTTGKDISGGGGTYDGATSNAKIVVVEGIDPTIVAHEIGHAMGYFTHGPAGTVMQPSGAHNKAVDTKVDDTICTKVRGYTEAKGTGDKSCSM